MNFLYMLLIGFVVGVIAKFIVPGKDPGGCLMTSIIGIGGSIVGTYLGEFFGIYQHGEKASFIASVIGAVIILAVYKSLAKSK